MLKFGCLGSGKRVHNPPCVEKKSEVLLPTFMNNSQVKKAASDDQAALDDNKSRLVHVNPN